MNKGKIKAILFIVLFLLVLAAAVTLLLDLERQDREAAFTVPTPRGTAVPALTIPPVVTPVPTPVPTYMPTPAPTPVPTPIPTPPPTPAPTPTPVQVGQIIGTGTFTSETGVPMNIQANWTAKILDENRVRVTVEVNIVSYSLNILRSANALSVSVGDSYETADTPTLNVDNNTALETNHLATTEHTIPLAAGQSGSFPVQVQYLFRGVYFQRQIDTVECGGSITLSR